MTQTLLLRFSGSMQSWGTRSRFRDRDTGLEPSKSGVVGLLCAALGRPREHPVDDIAALRMGVRVMRPGVVRIDYQTAGGSHRKGERYGVARAENPGGETAISHRAYLADASFLVGLEAITPEQERLAQTLNAALAEPVWPLFLGRKSYVPDMPVHLPERGPGGPGVRAASLEDALRDDYWWAGVDPSVTEARLVLECAPGDPDAEERADWPLSFATLDRRYMTRYVKIMFLRRPDPPARPSVI